MTFRRLIPVAVLLLVVSIVYARNENMETHKLAGKYQARKQVTLSDGSVCDLLTDTHAIEVEWADHWKEAPGQAVLYSILTGKHPGIVLLVSDQEADAKHVQRCSLVCERLKISLWFEQVKPSKTKKGR